MKKIIPAIVWSLLMLSINSKAQKSARPEMVMKSMYIQIGGTLGGALTIPGSSTNTWSLNLIDVLAFSEGASASCTVGGCAIPNQQDLSMTIYQTANFPLIRQAILNNTRLNIELNVVNAALDISKIYLEDAYISSISDGGSGGEDRFTVNITFSSQKWDHYYNDAGPAAFSHYGWNFTTNLPFSHY